MLVTLLKWPKSQGGKLLAQKLKQHFGNRVTVSTAGVADTRTCQGTRVVINWGIRENPTRFTQARALWTNTPETVNKCCNKLLTLQALKAANVATLEFSTNGQELQAANPRKKIVARKVLDGSSGRGIEIVREGGAIPNAPLYTVYFKKKCEYRVHVAFGKVILIQQKRRATSENRPPEVGDNADLIRTHGNGWIFAVQNLLCDERNYRAPLEQLAIAAAAAVGAQHCAVDILANEQNQMIVCEINSAPGVEAESTINAYVAAFVEHIETKLSEEPVVRAPQTTPVRRSANGGNRATRR